MGRIAWIDAAKGIGIFLVVLGHALPPDALATRIIYAFHMPLFFLLSGFTARAWTAGSAPACLRALGGLRGLVVPYVFFSLVSIACFMTTQPDALRGATWSGQLRQMLYGVAGPEQWMRYNVPLWFFTCLALVRLAFAALTAVAASGRMRFAGTVLLAALAHWLLLPRVGTLAWNADIVPVALVFFMAGHGLQGWAVPPRFSTVPWRLIAGPAALLLLGACATANERVDMNGRLFGDPLWFYAGAFAGIVLVGAVSSAWPDKRLLKLLGNASIVIFPLHALFWLLPDRFFSILTWYAHKIVRDDVLVATLIAIVEIAACLPVYAGILRWAPRLIGKSARPSVSIAAHPA